MSGVQVYVRVRPMLARELQFNNAVDVQSNYIKVFNDQQEFVSQYSRVFPEFTSQEDVYASVRGEGGLRVLNGL